jgi:hypothetical protein
LEAGRGRAVAAPKISADGDVDLTITHRFGFSWRDAACRCVRLLGNAANKTFPGQESQRENWIAREMARVI